MNEAFPRLAFRGKEKPTQSGGKNDNAQHEIMLQKLACADNDFRGDWKRCVKLLERAGELRHNVYKQQYSDKNHDRHDNHRIYKRSLKFLLKRIAPQKLVRHREKRGERLPPSSPAFTIDTTSG